MKKHLPITKNKDEKENDEEFLDELSQSRIREKDAKYLDE